MKCRRCKNVDGILVDVLGSTWCEADRIYYNLMQWGSKNNYPVLAGLYGGSGAWKIGVPRLSSNEVARILESIHPQIAEVPAEALRAISEPLQISDGQIYIEVKTETQANGVITYKGYRECFKCGAYAVWQDKHERLWCYPHAPLGASVPKNIRDSEHPNEIDVRYINCSWYNTKLDECPASQALSYALHHDYFVLGLYWYTDKLQHMFLHDPELAKSWTLSTHDAYKNKYEHQGSRLGFYANRIEAQFLNKQESQTACFICGKDVENYDSHGRAYCIEHSPKVRKHEHTETVYADVVQEASTLFEDITRCMKCPSEATYFDPNTGDGYCEQHMP